MTQSIFLHGMIAGVFSGISGFIYQAIYERMYFVDFSSIVNPGSIMSASLIGCILMSFGYIVLQRLQRSNFKGWLNAAYMVLSFASILPAMGISLPLDTEFPELFPALVVPMHFFPIAILFGLDPFFQFATEAE